MNYRYLELVDPVTGEFYEVQERFCAKREEAERKEKTPIKPYNIRNIECKEFFMDFLKDHRNSLSNTDVKVDEDVLNILLQKELNVGSLALLAYIARGLYYRNYCYFVFKDFVDEMELQERTVYRYFENLISRSLIKEIPSKAPSKEAVVAINPNLFFVGTEGLRADAIKEWMKVSI